MHEGRSLEFKQDITNTFLKTVSAFANFGTGTILFGVDDNGRNVGVETPEKICLDIENRINDTIKPKPNYSITINKRTNVISLVVSEGKHTPYLYKGKAYRRNDTSTVEVDPIELKRLTLEGANLYYEELPYGAKQLDFTYFESKLIEKLGITEITNDILRTFGFINDDKQFNNAAALFADANQFSGIDMARFGKNISEILDRETFSHVSILKQYDMAVSTFKRYYQYEKIEGMEREKIDIIPETAFREAIANALIHRTWDIDSHIKISMFEDRIEISSPGGLPKGINKEEYINGYISNLRNPVIGNVFFRLNYIEMFGTGIRRIIESYNEASLKPSFEVTNNTVTVILPSMSTTYKVTLENQKIIDLLGTGLQLSSSNIAQQLKWSKDKTIRALNTLLSDGYVKKSGNGRATKYSKG